MGREGEVVLPSRPLFVGTRRAAPRAMTFVNPQPSKRATDVPRIAAELDRRRTDSLDPKSRV